MDHRLRVLRKYREKLELSLEMSDLVKLSLKLLESRIISKDQKERFASLDQDRLDPERRVRYLLQQLCERVRGDAKVYDRLIRVFNKLGGDVMSVCEAMRKELDGVNRTSSTVEAECFTDEDISVLVKLMVSGSHKWEEIGIALGLPEHVREDCRSGRSNASKLTNILTAWISRSYAGADIATPDSLRVALASEIVGLSNLAQNLSKFHLESRSSAHLSSSECIAEITYQSYDTEVAEGKSTLLEVQLSCTGSECYQWSKDGQPLLDGADFSGVSSNILYINRATQDSEGRYSCSICNSSINLLSDEIDVVISYPPEKEHLIKLYSLMESEVPKDSWPPVGTYTFINLVLIEQSTKTPSDYFTVHGDMDDILESKEKLEYKEVFKKYTEGTVVILEGRPGSGKTTLVHKVTGDWVAGKRVLQGVKVLFLLSLRLLNCSGKDKSLSEILELFYSDMNLRKKVEHDLQRCGGKGACFILDGLDEYQPKYKEESMIYQLIHKKRLPFSMVIVSSRPMATFELWKSSSIRIEVLGFTKQQIDDYIIAYPFAAYIKDNSDSFIAKLKAYLNIHANVLHMCYLPVHAAMICFLFSQLQDKIPHTETQIYEQFTISTLLRQKTRRNQQVQIKSLKDLHGDDKVQFDKVCQLAFEMLINSQQVVSRSDAQMLLSGDSTSDFLGLVTINCTSKHYGIEDMYSFLHLTSQEYLAALYVAKLEQDEQMKLMDEHSTDHRLRNIWKFYSGLIDFKDRSLLIEKMFSCLESSFLNKDLGTCYYVQCAFESQQAAICDYVVGDGTLSFRNSYFTPSDFTALGYVISTASVFVAKLIFNACKWDKDGFSSFSLLSDCDKLKSLKSLQFHNKRCTNDNLVGLNCLLRSFPFLHELDLFDTSLNKSGIEAITTGIVLPHLKRLKISLPLMSCSAPEEALKLLTFGNQSLHFVYFDNLFKNKALNFSLWKKCLCHAFNFQTISESDLLWINLYNSNSLFSISQGKFSQCCEIVLVNCGITDEGAETLAVGLNPSVLESIVLDFNRISDSGAVALAACIAGCTVVREISIQCNSIGDTGALAIAEALVDCNSLRILDLQGNLLGNKGAEAIVKTMEHFLKSFVYLCNVNITEVCIQRILAYKTRASVRNVTFNTSWLTVEDEDINTLKMAFKCGILPMLNVSKSNVEKITTVVTELDHLKNIRGLKYSGDIPGSSILALCRMMTNLQELILESVDHLSSTNVLQLSDFLKDCKSLQSIRMIGGNMSLQSSLLHALKHQNNLHSLSLTDFDMSSEGLSSLFQNRGSWINLHSLDLTNTNIDMIGAETLSRVLKYCNGLHGLYLSMNNIGDDGAEVLAEVLRDCKRLQELKLGGNGIGSDGVNSLLQAVNCTNLQLLDLSRNDVNTITLSAANHINLKHLDFSGTNLSSEVACTLVNITCATLQVLNLGSNPNVARTLGPKLASCNQLVELNLSHTLVGSHCMSDLARGLKHCVNLHKINLSWNYITAEDVGALAHIMKHCTSLNHLDLYRNDIGVDGIAILISRWHHKSLLRLDVRCCFGWNHESALAEGEGCCVRCDRLLYFYYSNDYIVVDAGLSFIPKLASAKRKGTLWTTIAS